MRLQNLQCFGFVIFTLIIFVCGEQSVRITLQRRKSNFERLLNSDINLKEFENYLKKKNGSNNVVPLFKFLDVEFYGQVGVGYPYQVMNVVFDTSWSDSWIPSILCPITVVPCDLKNKYDSSKSKTYIQNGRVITKHLDDGVLQGKLSTDLFHVGQLNVTNQTFIEVYKMPFTSMFQKSDGLVGLGLYIGDTKPLIQSMIDQGVIKNPIFSIYINRDPISPKGGAILFGDIDKSHYTGDITYTQVTPNMGYWQFAVQCLLNQTTLCSKCQAIASTSSSEIQGPKKAIDYIHQQINAKEFFFGKYLVDCAMITKLQPFTLMIEGKPFTIKGKDYIQQMQYGGMQVCVSAFMYTTQPTDNTIWVIGNSFMAHFYTIFDKGNNRIGFANVRM